MRTRVRGRPWVAAVLLAFAFGACCGEGCIKDPPCGPCEDPCNPCTLKKPEKKEEKKAEKKEESKPDPQKKA